MEEKDKPRKWFLIMQTDGIYEFERMNPDNVTVRIRAASIDEAWTVLCEMIK